MERELNNGFTISDDFSTVTCNKCGSTDVYIRAGMFVDTFICRKCGNEYRG